MMEKRLHGLDTLRALAIVLVLAYHYKVVVSGADTFGFVSEIGWTGVDLFFVLSGYLIGNQIFAGAPIGQFYGRRLLRTLPNYLVLLALYFVVPALAEKETAPLWRFLTFTQNLGMRPGQTFTHSWSLCIEEQFYLLLPLLVPLLRRRGRWLLMAGGMMAAMLARAHAWSSHGQEAINGYDYYQYIYYSSFCRFDELLPGVAIAMLKNFHPEAYARITRKGNALLVAGTAAVVAMFYLFAHEQYGCAITVFGYSALSLAFALLTLAALSAGSLLHRVRIPGAYSLALWSYAIYLAHKPIFKLTADAGIVVSMAAALLGGWMLFKLVESPCMALRARLYPSLLWKGANQVTRKDGMVATITNPK